MIYWDNNATTPLAPEVWEAMVPFMRDRFFNPSAAYPEALRVRSHIEEARVSVAELLGVSPEGIVFTSGGTEASNMALRFMARGGEGILCVSTDHDATLKTAEALGQGKSLYCPVDAEGRVDASRWAEYGKSVRGGVSFAWANNETGVLQDVDSLCSSARRQGLCIHMDAVQCVGKMPVSLQEWDVDFVSVSAHKFHGPKGIGCLYRRAGGELTPLLFGGGQEFGWRSGTENVAGIIGFGMAARLAMQQVKECGKLARLRDRFESLLREQLDGLKVHSSEACRISNTSNICFEGCTAEALLLLLEPSGLICSAGSACHAIQPRASHVLTAMGCSDSEARSSLRFSLSTETTEEEVLTAVGLIVSAVRKVRGVQSTRTGPVLVFRP